MVKCHTQTSESVSFTVHLHFSSSTDNLVPYDGVPVEEDVTIALFVTVIFFILATAGVLFATVCLILNYINRNKR